MENLARYIIRASFSQERMNYLVEESKVVYKSKDGKNTKEFEAVDFIASLVSHIPNRGEQMVRYLGYCSNVCRDRRKKQSGDGANFIIANGECKRPCNKSWARLTHENI